MTAFPMAEGVGAMAHPLFVTDTWRPDDVRAAQELLGDAFKQYCYLPNSANRTEVEVMLRGYQTAWVADKAMEDLP